MIHIKFVVGLTLACFLCVNVAGQEDRHPIIGGFSDLSSEEVANLHIVLMSAFQQLNAERYDFKLAIYRILSAKTQVVAGQRYLANVEAINEANEIKKCEAEIVDVPWKHSRDINITCDKKKYNVKSQI